MPAVEWVLAAITNQSVKILKTPSEIIDTFDKIKTSNHDTLPGTHKKVHQKGNSSEQNCI